MSPAKYGAYVRAWKKRERRKQSRFAMLALVAAQCAGNKDATASDFMAGFDAEDDE